MTMTADDAKAVPAVEGYVSKTREWPKDSYRVELNRRDGEMLTFWVVHKDDEAGPIVMGGGGKSFSVDADAKSLRVIRELAFQ